MAVNAFIQFKGATGESVQKGKEGWTELQGWDWEVEAESSWTKGGGASVGKPNPGKLNFEHYFDKSSPTILKFITTGQAFETVVMEMMKTTGAGSPETYFKKTMTGAYITKVSHSATEEGNVTQKIEFVFKSCTIDYKPQNSTTGKLDSPISWTWDVVKNVTT